MQNPYTPPKASLAEDVPGTNTSGMGKNAVVPDEVKGWSWGAFFLNWIWAVGNKTWIGLLCLAPYVGVVMTIVLGFKGREWAWKNKRWDSIAHFNEVQRRWSFWGVALIGGVMMLGILAAIAIPAYQDYVNAARAHR